MKKFVHTSGVPVSNTKPMLDGRIVGGTPTTINNHPFLVWPLRFCSVRRTFEVFEHKGPHLLVITKS